MHTQFICLHLFWHSFADTHTHTRAHLIKHISVDVLCFLLSLARSFPTETYMLSILALSLANTPMFNSIIITSFILLAVGREERSRWGLKFYTLPGLSVFKSSFFLLSYQTSHAASAAASSPPDRHVTKSRDKMVWRHLLRWHSEWQRCRLVWFMCWRQTGVLWHRGKSLWTYYGVCADNMPGELWHCCESHCWICPCFCFGTLVRLICIQKWFLIQKAVSCWTAEHLHNHNSGSGIIGSHQTPVSLLSRLLWKPRRL